MRSSAARQARSSLFAGLRSMGRITGRMRFLRLPKSTTASTALRPVAPASSHNTRSHPGTHVATRVSSESLTETIRDPGGYAATCC